MKRPIDIHIAEMVMLLDRFAKWEMHNTLPPLSPELALMFREASLAARMHLPWVVELYKLNAAPKGDTNK